MAKMQVRKCKKCGEYTKQIYLGKKAKSTEDIFLEVMMTLATGGLWLLFSWLFDDRPRYWECTSCGTIHKSHD